MFVVGDINLENEIGKNHLLRFKEILIREDRSLRDLIGCYALYQNSGNMQVGDVKGDLSFILNRIETVPKEPLLQVDHERIRCENLFFRLNSKERSIPYQGFTHQETKRRFFVPAGQFDYVKKAFQCTKDSPLLVGYKNNIVYLSLKNKFAGIAQIMSSLIKEEYRTSPP